jgi:cardiolipin-specific phospholipase
MVFRIARQWWTQSSTGALQNAQDSILKAFVKAGFVRTSSGGLNSVEFVHEGKVSGETVVLAHGFGSGLGFFYSNVDPLLQAESVRRVVLVDWLGMGGSDRPGCRQRPIRGITGASTSWCDSRFSPSEAVDFFIHPFQQWMESSVIGQRDEKVVLVGHSLGGYLAARYALRYPEHLSRLVLASPVGFPAKPENALSGSQLPTSLRVIDAMWSSNITPQQLVRLFGATRGRANTQRVLQARMPQLQPSKVKLLSDYLYHITVADPSGEFAMNSLLEPVVAPDVMGVFAREPLQESLIGLDTSHGLRSVKVLFGDHDWMRPNEPSARQTLKMLKESAGIETSVDILPNAGHHLYMETPSEFVRHITN